MRRRLLLIPALAALLVAFAAVSPVDAGQNVTIDVAAECNTETGEYDITITLTNIFADDGDITVNSFQIDGNDESLTFSPNPIPGVDGVSVATFSAPGDTTAVFVDVTIDYPDFSTDINSELTLEGDCEPPPTTTTTTTTTLATTTTAAASPITLQPAFTG